MVVFEGGAPKKSDYRRFTIREVDPATITRPWRRSCHAATRSGRSSPSARPTTPSATRRSPRCPNLIVIDGGKGQLAAGLEPLQGFREHGVAVVSLAKRIEEVFLPGSRGAVVLAARHAELQLLQRVRDEAHRFAITHHRIRRDKAMTESIMDDLPASARRASARCSSTSARRTRCSPPRARSSSRCPACRRRSPAPCTPTSTRRADERHGHRVRDTTAAAAGLAPRGLRDHLRPLRGREVVAR